MLLPYNKNKIWFTVVGTGRCGSVFFAKTLTEIGLPCGHERLFGPGGLETALKFKNENSNVAKHSGLKEHNFYVAESSYMAVPYLEHSLLSDSTIIHAVRNPLKVILSFHNKLQYWHETPNKWESFINRNLNMIDGSALDKCCHYVYEWNRLIEQKSKGRKYHRVKLEDGLDGLLKFLKSDRRVQLKPANTFEEWEQKKSPLKNPATEADILSGRFGNKIKSLMKDYDYV